MNKFIIDSEKTRNINRLYMSGIIGFNPYNEKITLDSIYNNIFSIILVVINSYKDTNEKSVKTDKYNDIQNILKMVLDDENTIFKGNRRKRFNMIDQIWKSIGDLGCNKLTNALTMLSGTELISDNMKYDREIYKSIYLFLNIQNNLIGMNTIDVSDILTVFDYPLIRETKDSMINKILLHLSQIFNIILCEYELEEDDVNKLSENVDCVDNYKIYIDKRIEFYRDEIDKLERMKKFVID